MKKKIYTLLFDQNNPTSKIVDKAILLLILINLVSIMLESVESISIQYTSQFFAIEIITIAIFSVEYILRVYSSNYISKENGGTTRIQYLFSFMAVIDLIAILPFFIPLRSMPDLRFLRVMRMFRMFRVFRMLKFTSSLELLWSVIKKEKRNLLITGFASLVLLIVSSFLMYQAEHVAQPVAFASIFHSLWWAVCTLTTVGYGDVYPITILGKIISSFVAILGIALVAMPSGIIASGFVSEISEESISTDKFNHCPYCGKKLPY